MSASSNAYLPAAQSRANPLKSILRDQLARDQEPAVLRGGPALVSRLIGLVLVACMCAAAIAYFGDEAMPSIARWAQQLVLTSSQLLVKPLPTQPSQPGVQAAAAEPAPLQPAHPEPARLAQTAPQDVAPTAAQVPPVLEELLQTIMRDLTNVEQEIEQLKASQAQMAHDTAMLTEQVKSSQEQMARVSAKTSEQDDPRPRKSALHLRPSTHKPARTPPALQAASAAAGRP